ncbi:hypothetical protein F4806DRAFT_497004 [Annulohypoxylon nitens]|nr:hypothetical protein F4806DRAFT_497004 [Annulohypoxylon nitens]
MARFVNYNYTLSYWIATDLFIPRRRIRKRNHPRPKKSRRMDSTLLLLQFLPEDGFHWYSKRGKPFLTNQQARHITKSMKRAGRKMDENLTVEYMTNLFRVATKLVGQCGKLQPHQFWGEVRSHLRWARDLDGGHLLDFSNKIISARNGYNNSFYFYREFNKKLEDIPEDYKEHVDNDLTQAIKDWVTAVHNEYGEDSEVPVLYYPQWLVDSDNEGTMEDTNSRFLERIEELKQQKDLKKKAGDTAGVASADDQDMEMGGCEEHDSDQYNEDDDEGEDEDGDDEDYGEDFRSDYSGDDGNSEGVNDDVGDVKMLGAEEENQPTTPSTTLPFRPR